MVKAGVSISPEIWNMTAFPEDIQEWIVASLSKRYDKIGLTNLSQFEWSDKEDDITSDEKGHFIIKNKFNSIWKGYVAFGNLRVIDASIDHSSQGRPDNLCFQLYCSVRLIISVEEYPIDLAKTIVIHSSPLVATKLMRRHERLFRINISIPYIKSSMRGTIDKDFDSIEKLELYEPRIKDDIGSAHFDFPDLQELIRKEGTMLLILAKESGILEPDVYEKVMKRIQDDNNSNLSALTENNTGNRLSSDKVLSASSLFKIAADYGLLEKELIKEVADLSERKRNQLIILWGFDGQKHTASVWVIFLHFRGGTKSRGSAHGLLKQFMKKGFITKQVDPSGRGIRISFTEKGRAVVKAIMYFRSSYLS